MNNLMRFQNNNNISGRQFTPKTTTVLKNTCMDDVVDVVNQRSKNNTDIILPVSLISVKNGQLHLDGQAVEASDVAITDLAQHLSAMGSNPITVNTRMFREAYTNDSSLFSSIFEHVMRSLNDKDLDKFLKYRLSDNGKNVRAIVSEKYENMDNFEVLTSLLSTELKNRPIKEFRLSDNLMKVDFVFSQNNHIRKQVGDILSMFSLINSETRYHKLSLLAGLYRLACTNGMITPVGDNNFGVSQVHKGNQSFTKFMNAVQSGKMDNLISNIDNFAENYNKLYDNVINHQLTDKQIKEQQKLGMSQEKYQLRKELETTSKKYNVQLPDNLVTDHFEVINQAERLSRFNFVNAITRYSQTRPLEEKLNLDNIAFKYVQDHTRKQG